MSSEELLEIFTEEGIATGQPLSRVEVHKNGIWHKTVHTWIFEKSTKRLLLQRRSPLKLNHPDMWDVSSAGHISFGQTSKEAAIREVEEELGINDLTFEELNEPVMTIKVQYILNNGTYFDNEYIDVFLVIRDFIDINKLKLQKEEVCDVKLCHYKIVEQCYKEKNKSFVNVPELYLTFFDLLNEKFPIDKDEVIEWPSFISH
ncbi:hypothetical protein ABK040_002687 [Willaertia magna]